MWNSPWVRWGVVLGVALGGFFDGILLHQILQWHHLLSLVPGMDDIRLQVLWDGVFHALMYLVAVAGLVGLWRAYRHGDEGRGRAIGGALLVGFGLWHVADGVLSHWLLGIHRVRDGSENLLLWDLGWFTVFGVLPIVVGTLLIGGGGRPARVTGAAMLALSLATAGAGAWALVPPPDQPFTMVVDLAPGVSPLIAGLCSCCDPIRTGLQRRSG